MLRILVSSLLCLSLLAGCASSPASPSSTVASPSPGPRETSYTSPEPSHLAATPRPTGISIASPSLPPLHASVSLPVRGSAREIGERVLMAPGPGASLYVVIPRPGGSVLALLDQSGVPRPGWPIVLANATACDLLLPVEDGSVRVICSETDLPQPDNDPANVRAFAFDGNGRAMRGWPVQLEPAWPRRCTAVVIGTDLIILDGEIAPSAQAWLTMIDAAGAIEQGAAIPGIEIWSCGSWALGPDGSAYGVHHQVGDSTSAPKTSNLIALTSAGAGAGLQIAVDGIASRPVFDAVGNIILTVSSFPRSTSRIDVVDPSGARTSSAELPIATGVVAYSDGAHECGVPTPRPALIARDGMIVVFSEIDDSVFALDSSMHVVAGWPYEPSTPLVRRQPPPNPDGIDCSSLAIPAMGRDGRTYMPLQARNATTGGNLVAVGRDGRVRPGWPVELKRPGAEFWSVVAGFDGTVYALAIEPEGGDPSSATILAIAPDSTVRWTSTIVEP